MGTRVHQVFVALAIVSASCADDAAADGGSDSGTHAPTDTGDTIGTMAAQTTTGADTSAESTGATTGDTSGEGTTSDGGSSESGGTGTTAADGSTGDTTGGQQTVAAVPGMRCAPGERMATVSVSGEGLTPYVHVQFDDAPPPQVGEPVSSTEACDFYDAIPEWPCGCAGNTICDLAGECVERPQPVDTFELVISDGDNEASFDAATPGGQLNFGDVPLSFVLTTPTLTVTLDAMAVPGALTDVQGTLTGTYDAPVAIDLSWQPEPEGTLVLSRTDINHHVFAPVFTDCTVPASAGALHIDEDMLVPLAVVTGLEFQAIAHARVAAAQTDAGCVEFVLSVPSFAPIG